MKIWFALVAVALVIALPALADSAPAARRVVLVQVAGEGLARLEPSLRESLGRLALEVQLSRAGSATGDGAVGEGTVARVRVEISETGEVSVLVLEQASGRVLEQRSLRAGSDDLLEEQLTLLIRSALEIGLGAARASSVGSFAELPSPPVAPPAEPQATPALPPEGRTTPARPFGALGSTRPPSWDEPTAAPAGPTNLGWALGVEPSASLRWWSADLPARRVVALSLSLAQRELVGSPGVAAGFGYYESAVSDTEALSFDLETREVWLMGRASLLERPSWEWDVASGPTLLWSQADVRAAAAGYQVSQPGTHWDLVWRAQTSVRWWVQERLALGVVVGLDYDASTAAYGVREGGHERTIASEGRLRPALGLSLGTELGGGR